MSAAPDARAYWAPFRARMDRRILDGLDVLFDPVSSMSHFLAPMHAAVFDVLPMQENAALVATAVASAVEAANDVEGEGAADLAAQVDASLAHLLSAGLIELAMPS